MPFTGCAADTGVPLAKRVSNPKHIILYFSREPIAWEVAFHTAAPQSRQGAQRAASGEARARWNPSAPGLL